MLGDLLHTSDVARALSARRPRRAAARKRSRPRPAPAQPNINVTVHVAAPQAAARTPRRKGSVQPRRLIDSSRSGIRPIGPSAG